MTKYEMSPCYTYLIFLWQWTCGLSAWVPFHLYTCFAQCRWGQRGEAQGGIQGINKLYQTAGVISFWIQIKDVICYSSPDTQLLFLHSWQDSWTEYWTYPSSPGGINVWIDRAIATSQLQKLSTWWCDFRAKVYYGYPRPYSSMLCKLLMLKLSLQLDQKFLAQKTYYNNSLVNASFSGLVFNAVCIFLSLHWRTACFQEI